MPDTLLGVLRGLVPPGAGVAWADPRVDRPMMAGEDLPRAVPTRLREFAAGRHAARTALQAIGVSPVAIAHGADRAPVWPAGIIGSITHTATDCLAVALHAGDWRGIGVDLEAAVPLDAALWETVLRAEERDRLMELPEDQRGLSATRIFCAKEAAFKAFYPITRTLVGFEVLHIDFDKDGFTGTFQTALPPLAKGGAVWGRIAQAHGHIVTLAVL